MALSHQVPNTTTTTTTGRALHACIAQCFHFQEISFFWRNLRNFERLKKFFKEFQKFKEFQGIWKREGNYSEIQGIQRNLSKIQRNWIKFRKIIILEGLEALGRVFHLIMSLPWGGGGGVTSICMHIGYVPQERPLFSALNFRSGA